MDYRFEHLNADGQLLVVENLEAQDDIAAFEVARTHCRTHSLEVWQERGKSPF